MQPQTLLPILLGGALAAGGILQGLKWRNEAAMAQQEDHAGRLAALQEQVALLERENESLRSLAQGGGEIHVPPALVEFAEARVGLDYKSSPVIHQIASEELGDRIIASIESRFPPNELSYREQAWQTLGLLGPDDRFAPQLSLTRSLGARAWFDDQTGDAWVTNRFRHDHVPDQSSLLRALVRILLHQHYPPVPGYLGDEADRARTALHHGTAMAVENQFLARQALGMGFTGSMDQGGAERDLLNSLPAFIRGLAVFPSQFGQPFASQKMQQEEILSALHEPPTHTAAFFLESLPELPPLELAPAPGEPVLEESLGMLGLGLWLSTLDPELAELAQTWRGDLYQLHARSDLQLDLRWVVEVADPQSAQSLLEAALGMIGLIADLEADPAAAEVTETIDGTRLRAQLITPTRLEFHHLAAD
ncbi:MAG: hypothetical protein ACQKBU_06220 [Verrucomicrobiales bacterium]